jgi:hypothetical protein
MKNMFITLQILSHTYSSMEPTSGRHRGYNDSSKNRIRLFVCGACVVSYDYVLIYEHVLIWNDDGALYSLRRF